jgi:hypothetical protein
MSVKFCSLIVACLTLVFATPSYADVNLEAVPTGWRLQNYVDPQDVVTWFTGSPCTNGQLSFPSTTSAEIKNRYYSLILSAKISGKTVGIFYQYTGGTCMITSFYAV